MPKNISKKEIVDAICRVAKQLHRTPSLSEFLSIARIPEYSFYRHFRAWDKAVRIAGLLPASSHVRHSNSELLTEWGQIVRRNRGIPSRRKYLRFGRHADRTLERRFGGPWSSVPQAFRKFARGKREWDDVVALLPSPSRKPRRVPARRPAPPPLPLRKTKLRSRRDRLTYGNPISFRALRNEPVNEQGVVVLFAILAQELGYLIESVQKGFPDCHAMRQFGPDCWERVRIEFEFESRNFRNHGHPADGCDVIVCWRHNWPDCPRHIEIVELSRMVRSQ